MREHENWASRPHGPGFRLAILRCENRILALKSRVGDKANLPEHAAFGGKKRFFVTAITSPRQGPH